MVGIAVETMLIHCQACHCLNPEYNPSTDTSDVTTPEPGKLLVSKPLNQI